MSQPLSARSQLKRATDAAHRQLDAGMGVFELTVPQDYARFLAINAAALLPAEAALEAAGIAKILPDWTARRRSGAILADLRGLGMSQPHCMTAPRFADQTTAMGAAYVLEGSRLGGRLLSRIARGATDETIRGNMRFLSHGEGAPFWPLFLEHLEHCLTVPTDRARATDGALATFALFQTALDRGLYNERKVDVA